MFVNYKHNDEVRLPYFSPFLDVGILNFMFYSYINLIIFNLGFPHFNSIIFIQSIISSALLVFNFFLSWFYIDSLMDKTINAPKVKIKQISEIMTDAMKKGL